MILKYKDIWNEIYVRQQHNGVYAATRGLTHYTQ